MATVTFILGYCGSGKSYLADEMVRSLGVQKFDESFVDDPAKHSQLMEVLRQGTDCVVVEIEYCLDQPRQAFVGRLEKEVPGGTIKTEYFEPDLIKANENCRRRKEKGNAAGHIWINNHRIGSGYKIPPETTQRVIYLLPEEN